MRHLILGYAMDASLPLFTREDLRRLTHINLAFGLIRDGGLTLEKLTHLDLLPQFRAWNPDIHIVLSVGGWGAGGFSEMARTAEGRRSFARCCRRAVDEYGLDGIDIDWEYPCSDLAGIDADPSDRETFTLLLQALREALGDHLLSVAVGASTEFVRSTQMDQVCLLYTSVLDGARLHVADVGPAVGRGRAVEEREDRRALALGERLFHDAVRAPELQDLLLALDEVQRRGYLVVHERHSSLRHKKEKLRPEFLRDGVIFRVTTRVGEETPPAPVSYTHLAPPTGRSSRCTRPR